jgi:hypothetical protein
VLRSADDTTGVREIMQSLKVDGNQGLEHGGAAGNKIIRIGKTTGCALTAIFYSMHAQFFKSSPAPIVRPISAAVREKLTLTVYLTRYL